MKQIFLTNSPFYATVDDEDYDTCISFRWRLSTKGYVEYHPTQDVHLMMHNFVLGLPNGSGVDHQDQNKLNNSKGNLRIVDNGIQGQNRSRFRNNTSGYKGVSFKKSSGRWGASIKVNYQAIHIGYYDSKEDAARAYDRAAIHHFGPEAFTNFPKEARVL